jgi:hypothetical protein
MVVDVVAAAINVAKRLKIIFKIVLLNNNVYTAADTKNKTK